MIFKEADNNYAQNIADFQLKMAKETEGIDLDKTTVLKGVEAVFSDENKGKYYIVIEKDAVIASLLTTYEWSDWRNAFVIWIQSVFVLPEYRGKGIFKMMYGKIKQIVLNSSRWCGIRLYVDKTNLNAVKVYQSIGMEGEHYTLFEDML